MRLSGHALTPCAGNTLFYDRMQLDRRQVNSLEPWPPSKRARPPFVNTSALLVDQVELEQALARLASEPVIWLGAVFHTQDGHGQVQLEEKLVEFDGKIQLCPEC